MKKISIQKNAQTAAVLRKLRAFLDREEPQLVYFLQRIWRNQGRAITYKELREAILAGEISWDILSEWQQDYTKFVDEVLKPTWIMAMQEAAKEIEKKYPDWYFDPYADGVKYTGTIATKTQSDLTASGATVSVPKGYYASNASKSVASGSASTPATSITANPSITVSSGGLITASVSESQSVTPAVSAGYVASGTAGTVSVSGSATEQLTVQSAQTIMPSTSDQTISSGTYLTGTQTIKGDANLVASNIKAGVDIFGVEGTLSEVSVSQDSATKVLTIS